LLVEYAQASGTTDSGTTISGTTDSGTTISGDPELPREELEGLSGRVGLRQHRSERSLTFEHTHDTASRTRASSYCIVANVGK
jgi:hypothetical protein